MSHETDYVVEIDTPVDATICECSGCGWTGPFSELQEIEQTLLTPGCESPAGRCPDTECQALAYVIQPPKQLYILHIRGSYGDFIRVYSTYENATARAARWAREWWVRDGPATPIPDTDEESVLAYFLDNYDEGYSIDSVTVDEK